MHKVKNACPTQFMCECEWVCKPTWVVSIYWTYDPLIPSDRVAIKGPKLGEDIYWTSLYSNNYNASITCQTYTHTNIFMYVCIYVYLLNIFVQL